MSINTDWMFGRAEYCIAIMLTISVYKFNTESFSTKQQDAE